MSTGQNQATWNKLVVLKWYVIHPVLCSRTILHSYNNKVRTTIFIIISYKWDVSGLLPEEKETSSKTFFQFFAKQTSECVVKDYFRSPSHVLFYTPETGMCKKIANVSKKLYFMVCLAEHVVSVCVYMSSMFHCPTFQNTVFECKSSLYGFVLLPDYNKTIQEWKSESFLTTA